MTIDEAIEQSIKIILNAKPIPFSEMAPDRDRSAFRNQYELYTDGFDGTDNKIGPSFVLKMTNGDRTGVLVRKVYFLENGEWELEEQIIKEIDVKQILRNKKLGNLGIE